MAQYTVKGGDTLFAIAQKYLGDGNRWRELGYTGNPNAMPIGTILTIPSGPASQPAAVPQAAQGTTATAASASTADAYHGLSGGARPLVDQIVDDFLRSMGYPNGVDALAMSNFIATHGLQNNPDAAFQALYNSSLVSPALRAANPWAGAGMTEQQFATTVGAYNTLYFDLTGTTLPDNLKQQAMTEHWSTAQLSQKVMNDPALQKSMPFLAAGQSYTQVREAFFTDYGKNPSDTKALTTWWNFKRGTREIAGNQEAHLAQAQSGPIAPGSSTETR